MENEITNKTCMAATDILLLSSFKSIAAVYKNTNANPNTNTKSSANNLSWVCCVPTPRFITSFKKIISISVSVSIRVRTSISR